MDNIVAYLYINDFRLPINIIDENTYMYLKNGLLGETKVIPAYLYIDENNGMHYLPEKDKAYEIIIYMNGVPNKILIDNKLLYELSPNQQKMIEYLAKNPQGVKSRELSLNTGVSNKSATFTKATRSLLME